MILTNRLHADEHKTREENVGFANPPLPITKKQSHLQQRSNTSGHESDETTSSFDVLSTILGRRGSRGR